MCSIDSIYGAAVSEIPLIGSAVVTGVYKVHRKRIAAGERICNKVT